MHIEQARKMRDGLLKGNSVMAQAWKELLEGGAPGTPAGPENTHTAEDTTAERKALGIPERRVVQEGDF